MLLPPVPFPQYGVQYPGERCDIPIGKTGLPGDYQSHSFHLVVLGGFMCHHGTSGHRVEVRIEFRTGDCALLLKEVPGEIW